MGDGEIADPKFAATFRLLKELGFEPTRENYIDVIFLGEPPDPWTAEDEADLPEPLQDWSQFAPLTATSKTALVHLRDFDEAQHPRDESGKWTSGGGGDGGGGSDKPSGDKPAETQKPASNYGLVPGDVEKFHALKDQWATVNNDLLNHVDRPDSPEAQALVGKLEKISTEIQGLHADPGTPEGIGLPGGPRDVTIVGAGPGGLAAGIFGGAEGLDTLIVESNAVAGGQARYSSRIENFPGFPVGVKGETLTKGMFEQAKRLGAEQKLGVRVTSLTYDEKTGLKHLVLSNGEKIDSRSVILAGGVEFRKPNIPGADGPGVVVGDGKALAALCAGSDAVVIGGSNGAAQAALGAATGAKHVYLIARSALTKGMSDYQVSAVHNNPKITVIESDTVAKVNRDAAGNVTSIETASGKTIPCKAVGVFLGSVPETDWLKGNVNRDKSGRVTTNAALETNIPGVLAVGDMRAGAIGRIGVAVGEGQLALRQAHVYLESLKTPAPATAGLRTFNKDSAPVAPIAQLFDLDRENPYFGTTVEGVKPAGGGSAATSKKIRTESPAMGTAGDALVRARDTVREFNEDDHPRDESGKWTSGGGGDGGGGGGGGEDKPSDKGEHPGPGYSASARVRDGVIYTTSVYDAQRALHEDRKVELDQPEKVSILLQRLGAEAKKMIDAGKQAANINLCNVTVTGTNLFCADTKGIPRVEMPQLDKQQTKDFQKYLKDKGYKISKEKQYASHLRATQNELNGVKVAGVAQYMEEHGGKSKPIIISKDDYILDGHHAWAGKIGLDAKDNILGDDKKMDVRRVNISITKLLAEAEKFTGGKGHKPATESTTDRKSAAQILGDLIFAEMQMERAMPMTPHKDETQGQFMNRCVPEMIGTGADKRPSEQAVAACSRIWAEKDQTKQIDDIDPPEDDESYEDFMDRCMDEVGDDAEDQCQMVWDERRAAAPQRKGAPPAGRVFKTHVEPVNGMEFILSDESVDRMGDVISATGWDILNFTKNPIALFNHRTDFPIGKWRNLRIEKDTLRGHLVLAPEGTSPRIDEIRRLIEAGILRAVSVGFRPSSYEPLNDAEGKAVGYRFTKQELLETSLVAVPANPNALQIAKSLKISPATLDLVFAGQGNKGAVVRRRGSTGGHARRISNGKATTMSLAQRVKDSEMRLVALKDELRAHFDKIDDTNVTDDQLEKTSELNQKIDQEERTYQSLLDSERHLAATSDDSGGAGRNGTGRNTALTVSERGGRGGGNGTGTGTGSGARPFNIAGKKIEPLEYLVRAGTVQLFAHLHRKPLDEIRRTLYGEDEATKAVLEWATRAATAPAMTTVTGWAAELVQQIVVDFMALLMPKSVFPRLSGLGLSLTFGRNGKIIIPTRSRTPTIAGSFVGEGAAIPVRQGAFTSQTLTPKKMAVITTWTREIDEHSIPAIEGLLRNAIQEDTAVSLDAVLLDANPATVIRPAGILNGVSVTGATAGGGFTALVGDIKNLSGALLTGTLGNVRNPAWLMNPQQVNSAGLVAAPGVGAFPFREEISRGTLGGWPIIDSGTVPMGTVVAIDAADFVAVGGDAPRFEISDQATLHMEDTNPLNISTPGTPATVASPVQSLWQTDSLALRLILPLNWTIRRAGTVAWTQAVTW